jgi:glutamate racemase
MEPAVKPASKIAKKGIIILSSPKATKSKQLNSLIRTFAKDIKVFNLGSLQLVRAVEEKWSKERINKLFSRTLSQRILDKSDALVLGCTHFPLIKDKIQKYVGDHIVIIDSGEAVARRVKYLLKENKQLSADGKAKYEYYSSKNLNRKQKNTF